MKTPRWLRRLASPPDAAPRIRRSDALPVDDLLKHHLVKEWIDLSPDASGVYLFLSGRGGEELAWVLPSRAEMREGAGEGEEIRLAIVTENADVHRRALEKGHFALLLAGWKNMSGDAWRRWSMLALLGTMNACAIRAAYCAPEFFSVVPDARGLLERAWDVHAAVGQPIAQKAPGILATDVHWDFRKTLAFVERVEARTSDALPLEFLHYGSEKMFDYSRLGIDWRLRTLGWRIPDAPAPDAASPAFFVRIERAAGRVDVVRALKAVMAPLGVERIVVSGMPSNYLVERDGVEFEPNRQRFFDRCFERDGLLVSDGDGSLLPFLSAGRRVALVRNTSFSKSAWVRGAYFLGSDRWPVFNTAAELREALATHSSLDDFWKPWSEKSSPLESETRAPFGREFTQYLYERYGA